MFRTCEPSSFRKWTCWSGFRKTRSPVEPRLSKSSHSTSTPSSWLIEKSRQLQRRTSYFTENWRDLVLLLTTVLFTVVAWHADHNRPLWLPIFIAATLLSV